MTGTPPIDWIEIRVPVTVGAESAAEDVAALLASALADAAAGVELRAAEIVYWVPLARGEEALAAARSAALELASAGHPVDAVRVAAVPAAPEAEWRDAWKRYFRTVRLTRQIVVVPSWDRHDAAGDDRVVHLDPGQAFGTGAHASTRLVLEVMQDLADAGTAAHRVLDVGTGSGILALAAAALWPGAQVLGVDNDPVAVATASENAARNGADRVTLSGDDATRLEERFELVLANIQAEVLVPIADALVARVAPGGHIILSGLLSEQVDGVAARYAAAGLERIEVRASAEDAAWSAALLRRAEA